MIIIRILRFLRGYVSFTASGGFIERFVNLCTKNRIPLWNLKRKEDYLRADTTVKGYKIIRESAKRSGVRVSITKKHGLPFFMRAYRKRAGILIGFGFACLLVAFLSSMIWSISVSGNIELTDEQILEAFYENGVRIGEFKAKIDCEEAAYNVTRALPSLSFASVNIIGSRAEIVVNERSEKPSFPDNSKPCNIISAENGTVVSIDANIGRAEIEVGDAVVKGDLLISGITENADGSENLMAARGKVFASVRKKINTNNLDFSFRTQKAEKNRRLVYILGVEIPVGLPVGEKNASRFIQKLTNGEIELPLGIVKEHSYELSDKVTLPEEYRPLYCAKAYCENYRDIFLQSEEIISQLVTENKNNGITYFSGEYQVKKDIGVRKAILVDIS